MSHGEVMQVNGKRVATPEYRSWQMMKNRCLNPKAGDFRYYGGRGITICNSWHFFEHFLEDMGRRPSPKHTLDRKDVHKGYFKNNCRWVVRAVQSRNRTDTKFSEAKAAKIRELYATGSYFQRELAVMFNCTQASISQITRNTAWWPLGGAQ